VANVHPLRTLVELKLSIALVDSVVGQVHVKVGEILLFGSRIG
jgi:hypothetical protein